MLHIIILHNYSSAIFGQLFSQMGQKKATKDEKKVTKNKKRKK